MWGFRAWDGIVSPLFDFRPLVWHSCWLHEVITMKMKQNNNQQNERERRRELRAQACLNSFREGIKADQNRLKAHMELVIEAARNDIALDLLGFKLNQEKYPYLYKAAKEDPELLRQMFEQVYMCWENGCLEESLEGIEQDLLEGKRDNFRNIKMSKAYWNKLLEDKNFKLYVEDEELWKRKHANEKDNKIRANSERRAFKEAIKAGDKTE